MNREKHQEVLKLLSQFRTNRTAFSQLENCPVPEAFRCFEEKQEELLSAVYKGYPFYEGRTRLFPFLKRLNKQSIGLFGKTVAELCLREIHKRALEEANIQQDTVLDFLKAIVNIRKDLEEITPAGWIEANWENAPVITDESALFAQLLSEARKKASDEVTLIALIGGKEASGVADLTVRRIENTDSIPKIIFARGYDASKLELDRLEKSIPPNIRDVLKKDREAARRFDESTFEVELKTTLVEPANSTEKYARGYSIGLPIAIAIYSLVSKYRIRPNITATGVVEVNGRLSGVDEIDTKIKKLALYNSIVADSMRVTTLFGADVDKTKIEGECENLAINCHFHDTLKKLLHSRNLLIDPFGDYLTNLTRFDKSTELQGHDIEFYEKVYRNSASMKDTAGEAAQIFPIPYGCDPLPVAKYMAKLFAEERRELFQRGDSLSPVPIIINLDNLRNKTLIELFQAELSPKVRLTQIRHELQSEDAFVFICYGTDDEIMTQLCKSEIEFFQINSERIDRNQRLIVVAQNYHQMAKYAEVDMLHQR